jgi:hypothetical protein
LPREEKQKITFAISQLCRFRFMFLRFIFPPIWIVDAHRDGKRFGVRADEKLTAFLELESAIKACRELA